MSRRVLVTGGAGFVGSHLVRACLREGWEVAVLYQPEAGLALIQDVLTQIQLYPVLSRSDEVAEIFRSYRPELVFHLASVFIAQHKTEDVQTLVDANIAFGTQVLEAMAQNGVSHLVNTGTAWQHYQDGEYSPVNLYAATKQAFEDILQYYIEAGLLRAVTLKLYDTYGPGDPRPKLFNLLARAGREQSRLEMSPGDQLIDLVYVEDVANAFVVAAKLLFENQVRGSATYAVSSGHAVPLRELVELYKRVTGQTFETIWGGRPYREREVMRPWTRGERLPGWSPRVGLEEGIKDCASAQVSQTTEPLVTVCIPVYNCEGYIGQAIESVLAQTTSDFELLVVDNASTDGTVEAVSRYHDPRLRLIRSKLNVGLEGNWNRVLTEARGKYIKLLPADDFLYPTCLKRQVGVLEASENASVSLVICARDIISPAGRKLITRRFPGPERKLAGANAIRAVVRSGTNLLGEPAAIMFKRDLLARTGLFDGTLSYVIDVQLWLRMLLYGDLYVLSVPYCAFRLSSGATSLELAALQSRHFGKFVENLSADPRFGIRWLDRRRGLLMSRLLGVARRLFYLLSVHN